MWEMMDRAPRDGTFVIVALASGHVSIMQFCAAKYWRGRVDDHDHGIAPVAWQPCPAFWPNMNPGKIAECEIAERERIARLRD